ncbi:sod [Clostera anachoreta granulovirus]|uniref:superoxide dismutase n=1 Tax=Clostera anachoreta granulovirus TaxID=283675 RepID=F4ZKS5_9BBAC|nr:sod [Clostera anachoreta granulovirus]AEB00336.1 sod [Clostera anachoreta granulovirus]
MRAVCVIVGDVTGRVEFLQTTNEAPVHVYGELHNLPRGDHGFHVHEYGDVSNGCTSAGDHLNPHGMTHGGPHSSVRHLGDLGNIYSHGELHVAQVDIVDHLISLHGEHSVLGRSLVVHAMKDDYGLGDNELSRTTGNSGSRLGCGVIGLMRD